MVLGVNFASFVAPGLIAMGMINNAFANSASSLGAISTMPGSAPI